MTRRSIIEYLNNPKLLDDISISELKMWIKEIPYVQSLRRLVAMKSKIIGENDKNLMYDAAMYSTDRNKLFECLTSIQEEDSKESTNIESEITYESSIADGLDTDKVTEMGEGIGIEKNSNYPDSEKDGLTPDRTLMVPEMKEDSENEIFTSKKENSVETERSNDKSLETERTEELISKNDSEQSDDLIETDIKISELVETHFEDQAKPDELPDVDMETELSGFSLWLLSMSHVYESEDTLKPSQKMDIEKENVVSSTLAELLISQGHYSEARDMYKKLILKYPEKSAYFAAQIEKLKV